MELWCVKISTRLYDIEYFNRSERISENFFMNGRRLLL